MFSYITNYINKLFSEKRFYYLSLKKTHTNQYSIHGLWPQTDLNNYPTYCNKVNFSIQKLSPIITDLQKYWYSDLGTNDDFWKHEYTKHGSCMFNPMTEFEYFDKTLELYKDAINNDLPCKYEKEHKCLIPISLDFKFINEDNIKLDTIKNDKTPTIKNKSRITNETLYPIKTKNKMKILETIKEDEVKYHFKPIPNTELDIQQPPFEEHLLITKNNISI